MLTSNLLLSLVFLLFKEIESIMTNDQCPVFEYCELAHQDCWYVYYASEKETEKAYEYIRYQTYKGNPIKVTTLCLRGNKSFSNQFHSVVSSSHRLHQSNHWFTGTNVD